MKLGDHTHHGNVEVVVNDTDRGAGGAGRGLAHPNPAELRSLPRGACGEIFNAPLMARDERTMSPCILAKGHTDKHENAKGVSWGTRTQARRSSPSAAPTPTTGRRNTTVTGRTDTERKALMRQHAARFAAQRATPAPAYRYIPPTTVGPIADAQQAVRLAASVDNGWLPSQLSVIIDRLDDAASRAIRWADANGGTTHRAKARHVTGLVNAARASLGQGNMSYQRQAVETLRRAIGELIAPLAEQQRFADMAAERLAVTAADPRPRPSSVRQEHPWFEGHSVA
ncbi:hypothetical protein ACWGKK_12795 [Streptomyces chartreusis]